MHRQYEELANGIILQAVKDYRRVLKDFEKDPYDKMLLLDKRSIEYFFRSSWFIQLTKIDGGMLIEKLKLEVQDDSQRILKPSV